MHIRLTVDLKNPGSEDKVSYMCKFDEKEIHDLIRRKIEVCDPVRSLVDVDKAEISFRYSTLSI